MSEHVCMKRSGSGGSFSFLDTLTLVIAEAVTVSTAMWSTSGSRDEVTCENLVGGRVTKISEAGDGANIESWRAAAHADNKNARTFA